MLDPVLDEGARAALAGETQKLIEASGELKQADEWGLRKLAYEIEKRNEADYRFFRFVGENALLEQLDHNLKIADGALRFRIFRVDPDAPVGAPPATSQGYGPPSRSRDRGDSGEQAPAAPAEAAVAETAPVAAEAAPPAVEETPAEAAEPAAEAAEPAKAAVEPAEAAAEAAPEPDETAAEAAGEPDEAAAETPAEPDETS
jgi:ribosomal protein S6